MMMNDYEYDDDDDDNNNNNNTYFELCHKVQEHEIIVKQKDNSSSSDKNINSKSLNKCSYMQFRTDNDGPQFSKYLADSL